MRISTRSALSGVAARRSQPAFILLLLHVFNQECLLQSGPQISRVLSRHVADRSSCVRRWAPMLGTSASNHFTFSQLLKVHAGNLHFHRLARSIPKCQSHACGCINAVRHWSPRMHTPEGADFTLGMRLCSPGSGSRIHLSMFPFPWFARLPSAFSVNYILPAWMLYKIPT